MSVSTLNRVEHYSPRPPVRSPSASTKTTNCYHAIYLTHIRPHTKYTTTPTVWYGNPTTDSRYLHWNHEVLPHWRKEENAAYPQVGRRFSPPDHPHSPYYPSRGCYSSQDTGTLDAHMREIQSIGVGVMVVSWWGRAARAGSADTQGVKTDLVMGNILARAELNGISVAFHLEPYPGRDAVSIREDLQYIQTQYVCVKLIEQERSNGPLLASSWWTCVCVGEVCVCVCVCERERA